MRVARVQAQAKINLMLRVLARDANGYHDLVTHFHRIDLADEVVVRAGGSGRSLDCTGSRMPPGGLGLPEQNLAYRAAVEFASRTGWPDGFAIEITKHIPVGGGLGGGSADAAAVLRALNSMAPARLSPEQVWSVACALGSDVPFLASEHLRAIGTGRGTELGNEAGIPWLANRQMLIVMPPYSINTAEAYRWLDEARARGGAAEREPLRPVRPVSLRPTPADVRRAVDDATANDFESVVEARYPALRVIRERLMENGAELAHLAGSGSCVWGIFRDTPPTSLDLDFDAQLIPTRLSSHVVQVEVLE